MKKLLILMLIAAAITVAGCIGVAKTYTDPGQTVDTIVNQEFIIALGSNQSTGYSWQASYDQAMIELVKWDYEEEAEEGVVGAGGVEFFHFKALKVGQADITLVYKQDWEGGETSETKIFTINAR